MFKHKPCDRSQDFVWYFDFMFSNCWRFNSGKDPSDQSMDLKTLTTSGMMNGLRLDQTTGAHLILHDGNLESISLYKGVDVATGALTNAAVGKNYINRLEKPYSAFRNDIGSEYSYLVKAMLARNLTYTKSECILQCIGANATKECGWSHPALLNV